MTSSDNHKIFVNCKTLEEFREKKPRIEGNIDGLCCVANYSISRLNHHGGGNKGYDIKRRCICKHIARIIYCLEENMFGKENIFKTVVLPSRDIKIDECNLMDEDELKMVSEYMKSRNPFEIARFTFYDFRFVKHLAWLCSQLTNLDAFLSMKFDMDKLLDAIEKPKRFEVSLFPEGNYTCSIEPEEFNFTNIPKDRSEVIPHTLIESTDSIWIDFYQFLAKFMNKELREQVLSNTEKKTLNNLVIPEDAKIYKLKYSCDMTDFANLFCKKFPRYAEKLANVKRPKMMNGCKIIEHDKVTNQPVIEMKTEEEINFMISYICSKIDRVKYVFEKLRDFDDNTSDDEYEGSSDDEASDDKSNEGDESNEGETDDDEEFSDDKSIGEDNTVIEESSEPVPLIKDFEVINVRFTGWPMYSDAGYLKKLPVNISKHTIILYGTDLIDPSDTTTKYLYDGHNLCVNVVDEYGKRKKQYQSEDFYRDCFANYHFERYVNFDFPDECNFADKGIHVNTETENDLFKYNFEVYRDDKEGIVLYGYTNNIYTREEKKQLAEYIGKIVEKIDNMWMYGDMQTY